MRRELEDARAIPVFLLGTFALSYAAWGALIAGNAHGYLRYGSMGFWAVFAVGGLSPTVFGYIVSRRSGAFCGLLHCIKEFFGIVQGPRHYLLVLLLFAATFGVPLALGGAAMRGSLWLGLILVLKMLFFGGLEEIGWRFTLQPALGRHMPFALASLATSLAWALWHLPLFFMEGMNKGLDYWPFFISVLGMGFALGAIYTLSKSLWLCAFFHALVNAFSQVIKSGGGFETSAVTAAIQIGIALAAVGLCSSKSGGGGTPPTIARDKEIR